MLITEDQDKKNFIFLWNKKRMINKEALNNIISEYQGDDLAGHIVGVLEQIEKIRGHIIWTKKERRECERIHKAKLEEIDNALRTMQKECPHWSRTYHPDASGNNDSCYICDICEAEARR